MSVQSRERFGEIVRAGGAAGDPNDVRMDLAALLLAAENRADETVSGDNLARYLTAGLQSLDRLADEVPATGRDDERLRAVLAQFHGEATDYQRLEASLLPAVLTRQQGLPILLATVWTEVARRVDIQAYGVGLPGHFVVGIGDPAGTRVLVDPFRHGCLLPYDQARELASAAGRTLRVEDLRPHDPIDTIDRMLTNIRGWAARRPERARTRLWCCELALLLPRHDLNLRRDYAEALIAVGRYIEGAARLEEYADLVAGPMPLEADHARRTARQARSRLN
jgi:regulator of sirC expression with transglutaminase-like and TPR domain